MFTCLYSKMTKQKIPRAVREQLWVRDMGQAFQGKCKTAWCKNSVTVFDFQCGHNVPESKGGPTVLDNLVVICSRCNLSMGSQYTFTEWSQKHYVEVKPKRAFIQKCFSCFL